VAKTLKLIDAGPLQLASLYDRVKPSDAPAQRRAKHKASTEAQRRQNLKNTATYLELCLAVNFRTPGSARVATLTFDEKHRPKDRSEVTQRLNYFRRKYGAACAAEGLPEPVMFWCIEVLSAESGRWHVHIVISAFGDDDARIRRCWPYGSDVEIEKLRVDKQKNYTTLARYMTKEAREVQDYNAKPGARSWSHTQNARKPAVETMTVPDDYKLEPPEGCTVLTDERQTNEWTSWHAVKWLVPSCAFPRPPRAKRRRNRKS